MGTNPFAEDPSAEEIKKKLFKTAMKSNWQEVIDIYKNHQEVRSAKITRSGDTALHIAVSDGQDLIVEELVRVVDKKALEIKNELGNTPLHLAAYQGNVRMCLCIANIDSELMGIRNNDNETPFFLAVLHGKKDAFLCLHSFCEGDEGYAYCRGRDGETILHSAISGEYFDLAFQIIHKYEKLLNAVNEQGFSPLHILASKPSAFRSGSHIRGFDKLIYHCIFVDELELSTTHTPAEYLRQYDDKTAKYPENYKTCVGMFFLLKKIIWVPLGCSSNQPQDPEYPKGSNENTNNHKADAEGQQSSEEKGSSGNTNQIADAEGQQSGDKQAPKTKSQGHEFCPKNYFTCFQFLKFIAKAMLVILGLGSRNVEKIREKKEKHIWSVQIMEKLIYHASLYEYEDTGRSPGNGNETGPYALGDGGAAGFNRDHSTGFEPPLFPDYQIDPYAPGDGDAAGSNRNHSTGFRPPLLLDDQIELPDKSTKESQNNKAERNNEICGKCREILCSFLCNFFGNGLVKENKAMRELCSAGKESTKLEMEKKETPILIAAKNGIQEIVAKILDQFPVAIHDMNNEKKNIVLLAVENRQPHVYKFVLERNILKDTIFRKTDKDGNSALHLAAMLGDYRPWLIPGAALQLQWEIKWYEFVKNSMPLHFFPRYNKKFQTARDIFSETHRELANEGGQWLKDTSQSCSVVAALIATVAFATSATVPGGVKSESGTPTLQNEPAFGTFAVSSLVALCFSVTSVVMFLAILTSRYQEKDFGESLPRKLLVGLSSLFISIVAMLLSFCAGHFFVLKGNLQYVAFPMYAITCLPVTFFAVAQFPLYFDLLKATIKKVPQRSSK